MKESRNLTELMSKCIRITDTHGSYELFFILRKMGFSTYEVDNRRLIGSFMERSFSDPKCCSKIELRSTRTTSDFMNLFIVIGESY